MKSLVRQFLPAGQTWLLYSQLVSEQPRKFSTFNPVDGSGRNCVSGAMPRSDCGRCARNDGERSPGPHRSRTVSASRIVNRRQKDSALIAAVSSPVFLVVEDFRFSFWSIPETLRRAILNAQWSPATPQSERGSATVVGGNAKFIGACHLSLSSSCVPEAPRSSRGSSWRR